MHNATEQRRQAFSVWLRTGRYPGHAGGSRRELKFNPWHDRRDGRFTFAGAGQYFGPGSTGSSTRKGQDKPPIVFKPDPRKASFKSREEVDAWAAELQAKYGKRRGFPGAIETERQHQLRELASREPASPPKSVLNKVADAVSSYGESLVDLGKEGAAALYALATTNPATSVKNIEFGIAKAIDGAIAAEDTPAYVQARRAAYTLANASAHDVGYALGTISGNVALAVAPGAIVSKVSAVGRAGTAAKVATASSRVEASFGEALTSDYRTTFFNANPTLKNQVVVHHAVERQAMDRFPGTVTKSEMHSVENLRGIPSELNSDLHLRKIRSEWDRFYREFEAKGVAPTKKQLLQKAAEIDAKYGSQFNPPR